MAITFEHCVLRNEIWHPYYKFAVWVLNKYSIGTWYDFNTEVASFINAELEKYDAIAIPIPDIYRQELQQVTFNTVSGYTLFLLEWDQYA